MERGHLIHALTETMGPESETRESAVFVLRAAALLSEGSPVSVKDVVKGMEGAGEEALAHLQSCDEITLNDAGRITAIAGMSLDPTPHRFQVGEQTLYTWCAVDALFFPALLGRTADVTSHCPVSGVEIRLTVRPDKVMRVDPLGTVLSVVIPDRRGCGPDGCVTGAQPLYGAGGAFCGNVQFFRSNADTGPWLVDHPDAVVLAVVDAFEVARAVWAEPLLSKAGY